MLQKQETFDPKIFENKGEYDYYHVEHEDVLKSYLHIPICNYRNTLKDPKPWAKISDSCANVTGSADGRVWVSLKGNPAPCVAIPLHCFKDDFQIEMFPLLASIATLDTFNHIAPDTYILKFPNDIVCKEHKGKTSGVLIRKEYNHVLLGAGCNLVAAPENNDLRKNSITACCVKRHVPEGKVPTPEEFIDELFKNMWKFIQKFPTIEEILEMLNREFNKYENNYKLSINNPNADLKKDGAFWTQKFPNAYLKIDHKGMRYQYFESYYDNVYFDVKGDPSKEKPYHLKYEYIKMEDVKDNKEGK